MKNLSKITSILLLASSMSFADIYNLDVKNNTTSGTFNIGNNNFMDTIDFLSEKSLTEKLPSYNSTTDDISAALDMRGLPVTLDMTGNKVVFKVNSLGISETFEGASRDESIDLFEEWFKKNGASTLERIMKELARVSPVDPIAGNSNSAMARNVEADFTKAFLDTASKHRNGVGASSKNNNLISIDPTFKSIDVGNKTSSSYSLPLSYSFVSNEDADRKFTISLPLNYVEVEGAESYGLGLGISYSLPITSDWIITPALNYGVTGSVDLATLAQLGGASLTSSYTYTLPNEHRLSMGNMVGYYTTLKFYSGDYAYDPGITNIVYRNGLMYSFDTDGIIKNTSLDLFAINTTYTGTELYNDNYNEFGFSFGYDSINVNMLSEKEKYAYRRSLKVGASFLTSEKENGFKVNFGFTF